MMPQVSLNGDDWQIKGYYGEDWRWRDPHMPVNRDPRSWCRATVPGTIQNDLWAAGETPDPYVERNSLLLEWIPTRTWVYRKTFTLDPALRGHRARLRFEGVDYAAQFFLNGHDLGRHTGMYTPAVFEVGDLLVYEGENVLVVVIDPAPHEQPQVGRTSLVRTHKSRMTYWWDFCPRMVHVGLWDDVLIDFSGTVRIADIVVRPELTPNLQHADVHITLTLDALYDCLLIAETTLYYNGAVITSLHSDHTISAGLTNITMTLPMTKPRLWYPNGQGKQPLYEANVHLVERNDAKLDRCTTRFGIRRIDMVANEIDDPTARPYTLMVNGHRTYLKGWNWVPMDVMYGVARPDKLRHLLTLAKAANVNLLRIWGGGLIEKESFYDLCDELGIMVWQEFIMSSSGMDNTPATDPDYIAMMVREAEQIIPRRRHHPSLVIWCGGNELTGGDEQPLDDRHPLLGALKQVVNRLHPDALWLPTSPTGRVFSNSLANIERDPSALHDTHGPWEYQGVTGQYTLYNRGTSLLHSEFGVEGLTNLKALHATITPEHQFPVTLNDPVWHHRGAWWVKERVWRETFGEFPDLDAAVRATQLMHHDALRYALEADRRRQYQCSGTLPWQFNEPFPMAACTSAVDYYGQPKPSYYAVKNAYEPLHVSARFETSAWAGRERFQAQIWLNSSLDKETSGRVDAQIVDMNGTLCDHWMIETVTAPDSAAPVFVLEIPLASITTDVFFLLLVFVDQKNTPRSSSRYVFTKAETLAPLLTVPATTLSVERHTHGTQDRLIITNTGDQMALCVWIEDDRPAGAEGFVTYDRNYECLRPHEDWSVTVTWSRVPAAERRLRVRGWNTNTWKGSPYAS